ncbi:uncharacterized protein LOC128306863 [Anopheles moucheti]|uniref:uncharacterized protein LOC128306863 n=1 Tax=Anopheles moucheti TaxID=186751 RepID=UPI0022EFEE23|nr:uncharacterized protein LOC128306863 [Anopheles moucheti]
MKFLLATAVICSALALTLGVPVPSANPDPAPEPAAQPKTDIELMKIPLDGDKELDVITLVNSEDQKINERNKRTIGILRELFPTLSQILDQKIQMITSYLFRTIGPILLRSGLGLSGGGAGGTDNNRGSSSDDDDDFDFDDDDDSADSGKDGKPKVSISLPTFPPSDDDDDDKGTTGAPSLRLGADDDKNEVRKRATVTATATEPANERIDLLAAGQFGETSTGAPDAATTTSLNPTTSATETNLITTDDNANTLETLDLAGLSDTLNAIRVARATSEEKAASSNDQNTAESSANSSSLDELTLDSEGNDEDRNKRFLSFGGSSGGGGGSGNFLFDIIRLVSGSSGTEQSDEKAHSPDDHDLGKGDGYTEGIPGPVTRLFVLANRGLSNLIQDLILPMLFEASSPAVPTLPTVDVVGELSNVTARFANTLSDLRSDITNGTQQAVGELQKELAVLKTLAAPLDEGFASGLDSLVSGFGEPSPVPKATKPDKLKQPEAPQTEPTPFSLTSIFGF